MVTDDDLNVLESRFGVRLPQDYRDYMTTHGPGPLVDTDDVYVEIYTPETAGDVNAVVVAELADLYAGLFIVGSDGGGESLVLDLRRDPPPVLMINMVGGPEDAIEQAASFEEFVSQVPTRGLDFGI